MNIDEKLFIDSYDSSAFKKLSMTADVLLFGISKQNTGNYRKNSSKRLSILLVRRSDYPFKGKWSLPGGFMDVETETLEHCARRVLKRETNLEGMYLEQLYTFDSIDRDPRMRIVSTAFMGLVDKELYTEKVNMDSEWFNIETKEEGNITEIVFVSDKETFSVRIEKEFRDNTNISFEVSDNEMLAFDHAGVIAQGIYRLRNKVEYTDIVFNMMPELFTLGELQQVYEAILNKKLLDPAFRRIIASKVEKTEQMRVDGGHRPSYLFRYRK